MNRVPWARLMKFINPNTTESPIDSRKSRAESCSPFRVCTIRNWGSSSTEGP